jgi:hypothetical protein
MTSPAEVVLTLGNGAGDHVVFTISQVDRDHRTGGAITLRGSTRVHHADQVREITDDNGL